MTTLISSNKYHFDDKEHAHFYGDKPLIGVTTALSVLSKELTYWASGEACKKLGWLHPKKNTLEACYNSADKALAAIKGMGIHDYMNLLNSAYKAHAERKKDAAEQGKGMHELLEEFITARMMGNEPLFIDAKIAPFVRWADKNVKTFIFTEACCYSEVLWVGGIADFAYKDFEGFTVLGDFKSSDKAYWNHYMQLGGYHKLISENGGFTRDGQKLFDRMEFDYHAIFAERAGLDKPFINRDTARVRRAFVHCVELYREKLFWEGDEQK